MCTLLKVLLSFLVRSSHGYKPSLYRISEKTWLGPRRTARAANLALGRLEHELKNLEKEHHRLSAELDALPAVRSSWLIQEVKALKKKKLATRDRMTSVERRLIRIKAAGARILGAGGCGEVLEAIEESTGIRFAAKKASGTEARALLRREFRMLQHVKSSSHVVQAVALYDTNCTEEDASYIVMQHLGPSLEHLLWTQTLGCGGFPSCLVVALAHDLLLALRDLCRSGIVHGDLKPSNLCGEEPNGNVRLIDFGCAALAGQKYPSEEAATPAFCATSRDPNCARFLDDLEALGFSLAYLLSGQDFPHDPERRQNQLRTILFPPTPPEDTNELSYAKIARFIAAIMDTARRREENKKDIDTGDYDQLLKLWNHDFRTHMNNKILKHHDKKATVTLSSSYLLDYILSEKSSEEDHKHIRI